MNDFLKYNGPILNEKFLFKFLLQCNFFLIALIYSRTANYLRAKLNQMFSYKS